MAGLLIGAVGEGYCFLVDAVSYIAVIAALYAMTLPKRVAQVHDRNVVAELKEGVQYSFGFAPILALLVLVAMVSFATMPVMTLLPLIAVKLSDATHGAQMLGFLRAASGVGALAGSIYLASRKTVLGLGRVIVISCAVPRRGADGLQRIHDAGLVAAFDAVRGLRHDRGDGVGQHRAAIDHGRRQARPRDEFLCDGRYGRRTAGKSRVRLGG